MRNCLLLNHYPFEQLSTLSCLLGSNWFENVKKTVFHSVKIQLWRSSISHYSLPIGVICSVNTSTSRVSCKGVFYEEISFGVLIIQKFSKNGCHAITIELYGKSISHLNITIDLAFSIKASMSSVSVSMDIQLSNFWISSKRLNLDSPKS